MEKKLEQRSKLVDDLEMQLEACGKELNQLRDENTHKGLIVERENWRKLVNNLRQEKETISNENKLLRQKIKELKSFLNDREKTDVDQIGDSLRGISDLEDAYSHTDLQKENLKLRDELNRKELEINALKYTFILC